MENTLIIDCSSGMNIILQTKNEVFKLLDSNQKRHTDELLLSVDNLLNEANLKINDIKNLCVTVGPGSFTGIRVAISICKGLSIGTGARIFVANNFEVYETDKSQNYILILDGFSDFVYAKISSLQEKLEVCEHVSDLIEKIKTNYSNYKIFVQNEKLMNLLNENGLESELSKLDFQNCFDEKIKNNEVTEINQITPIYLRASQAEIERNKKLKGN